MLKNKTLQLSLLIGAILLLDQCLKIWVKTHFAYGEDRSLFGLGFTWARLQFVENEGMAFGLTLGGGYGKLALSVFRLAAIGLLIYYLRSLLRQDAPRGLILSFGAILAGAIGNMIDGAVYGLLFSASDPHHFQIATLLPKEGGYAPFLHGKVVDMLYFPMFRFPDSVPLLGGHTFFEHIFNLADASITTGVLVLLLFQGKHLKTPQTVENPNPETPLNTTF